MIPSLQNIFQKTEKICPKPFYKATIYKATTLISKLDKESKWEQCSPISLMNTNIFYKILAKWIQYIKRMLHHDHMGFISKMQSCFNIQK